MGWGTLKGKFVLTAGLGEMGGAQPLAITMNGGVGLIVEVDRWRAERRLSLRQLDAISDNLEEAMTWVEEAVAKGEAKSIGLIGNAAQILPELVTRGVIPDVVTDQTSAHDVLYGYIPAGMRLEQAAALRESDPKAYEQRSLASMAAHVRAMVVPGSGLVKEQAETEGLDAIFREAGFDWREPGCSMCLGMNPDRLAPGERCASTSNRNFEGRQGRGGRTHLMSPAMAAAAAFAGHIADVRDFR